MKKLIVYSGKGQRVANANRVVYRILPNRYSEAVGPFVFLDHIAPRVHYSPAKEGLGPHPHRGIATLSYILHGQLEHFDSAGNCARVSSGGVQWMKAGKGIIHDDQLSLDCDSNNNLIHGFQFWINLPSANKAEKPEHMAIQATEIPILELEHRSGWLKIIAGEYENLQSKIPDYSRQFLYHVHLESGKHFRMDTRSDIEYGAFLAMGTGRINGWNYGSGSFIEFSRKDGFIELENSSEESMDVLLFGGEHYNEPIVADGPFVMNSKHEIEMAFQHFFAGKYGHLNDDFRTSE